MNDDYYELQANGSAWTKDAGEYAERVRKAIDLLGDLRDLTIADVGCGDGTSTKYVLSKGAKRVIGMEYSKEKVDYANELLGTERGFVAWFDLDRYASPDDPEDEASDAYDGGFDLVFCSHTLEHTRDAVKSAENLCRMVKQGGKLYIIVPHEEYFPVLNPSHTQWMSNERIKLVKEILEKNFEKIEEVRMFRLEEECWLIAEGKR
jgi:SAM-dependent methyltransferase